jgi:predicted TIM-barrel fold metal-dependent hydrolase
VKSQHAYSRDIDYARVPPEQAAPVFERVMSGERVSGEERKRLEDHLFWQAVDEAAKAGLPVKLHTGYYAGRDSMPLHRLIHNAGSATELCRLAPQATFVFMHICYPYYEEILAAAKQHTNACIDLCWAWIINPIASKDFLKKYLMTAPANKILTFGGDYIGRAGGRACRWRAAASPWRSRAGGGRLVEPVGGAGAGGPDHARQCPPYLPACGEGGGVAMARA